MSLNPLNSELLCLIFILNVNTILTFNCKFSNLNYEDGSQLYTCEIKSDSQNQHLPDKTDVDVKGIIIDGILELNVEEFSICDRFRNLEQAKLLKANSIHENVLQNCTELNSIRISNGNIDKLSENLFSMNTKLTLVELSNNNLKELQEKFFINLKNLSALVISSNNLIHLPTNIFNCLKNLRIMSLENNGFKSLNPAWFKSLQDLRILILNFNKIVDLPKSVFEPLKNLQHLWLFGNELTVVHSDSFGVHPSLQNIDFKQNWIEAIDEKLIDNVAVCNLDMEIYNKCFNGKITNKNEVKKKLKKCFENYKPRKEPNSLCGTHRIGKETILGGTYIEQGSYPWNVALVTAEGQYFCGGTLVSNKAIVTAARCFTDKSGQPIHTTSNIKALLGAQNLNISENNKISLSIKTINIHSDWNSPNTSQDADIAVLELAEEVQFNDFIQPICLIESDSDMFENLPGKIVGFSENNSAKVYEFVVINHQTCSKNKDIEALLSSRTFCGEYANGTGSCSGDSGSGLIVNKDGNFYLHGIVSASLRNEKNDCKIAEHLVLTDVLKFTSFIKSGGYDVFDDKVRLLREENEKLKGQVKDLQEALKKKTSSWLCKFA